MTRRIALAVSGAVLGVAMVLGGTVFISNLTHHSDPEIQQGQVPPQPHQPNQPNQAGILELSAQAPLRPVPELMGWSTNGNFSIYDGDNTVHDAEAWDSTLTYGDLVRAKYFVIEVEGDVSPDSVQVSDLQSPGALLSEFDRGLNLDGYLSFRGNAILFDLSFVTGHPYSTMMPLAVYFHGIQDLNIQRVYLQY